MPALQTDILHGDCLEVLKEFPDEHFDLVFTSPPYADRRKNTYGGTKPEHYVEWFLPRAAEFQRVLKKTGSFVLNIKEKAEDGERHTFVIELILALRKSGWLWTEEYIWHKRNCHPGKWPNRFRDAWERCLHFTRERHFRKSAIKGIDLELEKNGILHIVTIKSGPDWGNDSQVAKMRDYFRAAARTLSTNSQPRPLVCINGCCYGRTTSENKGDYLKLCGQSFWEFISHDPELYRRIITPIGYRAQERNDEFAVAFAKVINQFTKELLSDFCNSDGSIDWNKLLAFNSGRPAPKKLKV